MLPKIIYFYWGGGPISFLRYIAFKSFRKFNPDWKIVLVSRKSPLAAQGEGWAEKQDFMFDDIVDYSERLDTLDIEYLYLEDEFPEIAKLNLPDVHTSDILAWYILAYRGGVVSDTDIIYFRPFPYDKYANVHFAAHCFEGHPKANYVPVSFMVGPPNTAIEKIYRTSVYHADPSRYESCGTIAFELAWGTFANLQRLYSMLNIQKLPSRFVFPFAESYPWAAYRQMTFGQNNFSLLRKESIGIHWYAGANQDFNRIITESTWDMFESTMTEIIRQTEE